MSTIKSVFLSLLLLVAVSVPAQGDSQYPVNPELFQALEWRNVGPFRGGRVPAVAGHPDQQFTSYQGATGGGVWKTTNGGISWENVSDGYFNTATIGAITPPSLWPTRMIFLPSRAYFFASLCTRLTSGQVASITVRLRRSASS